MEFDHMPRMMNSAANIRINNDLISETAASFAVAPVAQPEQPHEDGVNITAPMDRKEGSKTSPTSSDEIARASACASVNDATAPTVAARNADGPASE